MKGFTNFKTRLKPTSNKFCLRGSVCLFIANKLAAFMRQISSKYENAIVPFSGLVFTGTVGNFWSTLSVPPFV